MTERAAHIAAPRTSLGLVNVAAWQLGSRGSYAITPAAHMFVDVPKHRTRRLLEPSP